MSHSEIDPAIGLFSEPEMTPDQQRQFINAVSERVILGPYRTPLEAKDPAEGHAWTGFIYPQGIVLTGIRTFMFMEKMHREYAASFGRLQQNTAGDVIVEKEIAVLTNEDGDQWLRAHFASINQPASRGIELAAHPVLSYAQLSNEAIRLVADSNKRNYSSAKIALLERLREQKERHETLQAVGNIGHGATVDEAEQMLQLVNYYDPATDTYTPAKEYFEVSDQDIMVLADLAEKCARDSVLSQNLPERFDGYDQRNMRQVQGSVKRLVDRRVKLDIRVTYPGDKFETFSIAPVNQHAQLTTYTSSENLHGEPKDNQTVNIHQWAAHKTNSAYPLGSKPMMKAHAADLADILRNLRFDD